MVEATISELLIRGHGDALRERLNEITMLYKFVIDTLVRRSCEDPILRAKVNHPYIDETPDAVRGKTVSCTMTSGKRVSVKSPTFSNSRNTTTTTTLAVALLMKQMGDTFTQLWLIGVFCGAAIAPPDVGAPAPGSIGKSRNLKGNLLKAGVAGGDEKNKRPRLTPQPGQEAPPRIVENTHTDDGGRGAATTPPRGGSAADARTGPVSRDSTDVAHRLTARFLLCDGKVVAPAELHPEFALFHSRPTPAAVMTVFLREVAAENPDAVYPYGQDEHLCLGKGNPSATPVLLSSIDNSYRLAWLVMDIGYVYACYFINCVDPGAAQHDHFELFFCGRGHIGKVTHADDT